MAVNELRIMDREHGDVRVIWDPDVPAEVEAAKAQFDTLTKKGYMAYKVVGEAGRKGEQVRKFDPTIEKLILAPALRGG